MQAVSIQYPEQAAPTVADVYRAAQDARMYRIAARTLRRDARNETPSAVASFVGLASSRKADLLVKARRMERNARACERAIARYALSIGAPGSTAN